MENLATFNDKKIYIHVHGKMSMTYELFKRAFRILILDGQRHYKTILYYIYMVYTDDRENGLEVEVNKRKREFR